SQLTYRQSLLDYQDQLLRAGYRLTDTSRIDKKIKEVARLRSGLSRAEIELQQASADLVAMRLTAPFSGKIANMKVRVQNSSNNSSNYFCTIIDDSILDVRFQVLEQELGLIHKAGSVHIVPFTAPTLAVIGSVVSINPMVDEAGMVVVKARVQNKNGHLLDGMSVKVEVRE
ncbi:efflux RND transporter periplasmic adaptor subunit, partial [Noviherbaspirillum sp. ST9]